MQTPMRRTVIHDIPVESSPSLSQEEITRLINEIIQTWSWEGRQLGRVDLIHDDQYVYICSYGKPSTWLVPLSSIYKE